MTCKPPRATYRQGPITGKWPAPRREAASKTAYSSISAHEAESVEGLLIDRRNNDSEPRPPNRKGRTSLVVLAGASMSAHTAGASRRRRQANRTAGTENRGETKETGSASAETKGKPRVKAQRSQPSWATKAHPPPKERGAAHARGGRRQDRKPKKN